ncbi:hypothetical protein HYX01_00850 [Candidatus Woesearchaeota archaeon]|nr:hypothetical protein [Candidatus Woesearchaeota archaeon]
MKSNEVNLTYETLFELLKRERDITELQKLDATFFNNFVDYLNEKKEMLNKEDSLFSYDEKKKVERQIENARKLIKEMYERREKKILNLALIRSRTKSNVMDTSSLLESEKRLFDEIVNVLNAFRSEIISNVIEGRYASKGALEKNQEKAETTETGKIDENHAKLVRFLYPVPKFVGKELEEYGPFEEEDIANLPADIADVLVNKGRAEEIKEGI